jgi:hypothetical protein
MLTVIVSVRISGISKLPTEDTKDTEAQRIFLVSLVSSVGRVHRLVTDPFEFARNSCSVT